jgi:hypothetical protein
MATCKFLGEKPELKSPYIDFAINNLRVRRNKEQHTEPTLTLPSIKREADSREAARPTADVLPEY